VQYLRWIGGVVSGDWGRSIQLRSRVLPLVWERFQATLILSVAAMLIAVGVGIGLGVVSAVWSGTVLDRTAITTTLIGYSLPPFFLGIVLQVTWGCSSAGSRSRDVPAGRRRPRRPAAPPGAAGGDAGGRHRRAARAHDPRHHARGAAAGLRPHRPGQGSAAPTVVLQHAFRNALIPILTIVGLQTGYVLGGAVLVEQVFSWPGIGTLAINASSPATSRWCRASP
jgi:peptide/nickel transport system permease protein